MSGRVLFEWPNRGELIRFSVCERNGNRYAELRRFYRAGDEWKHSLKGCTMPLDAIAELYTRLGNYLAENAPGCLPGAS